MSLASQHGRYGYRQITGTLRNEGWRVNHKRVERIWRREGLTVTKKQPPRRRLWLTDGSCLRFLGAHLNHVWTYDFVATRTEDERPVKLLTIVDEWVRECLSIDVARRLRSDDVLFQLAELFVQRGVPEPIPSDDDPEFAAKAVREWLYRVGVQTLFITRGSPWENGDIESVNGKLRDELLNRELFDRLWECRCSGNGGGRPITGFGPTVPLPIARRHQKQLRRPARDSHSCWYNYRGQVSLTGRCVTSV